MKQWQRFSMPIGTTTSNWLFAAAGMVLAAAFILFGSHYRESGDG